MNLKRTGYILIIFITLVFHTIALSFWLTQQKQQPLVKIHTIEPVSVKDSISQVKQNHLMKALDNQSFNKISY